MARKNSRKASRKQQLFDAGMEIGARLTGVAGASLIYCGNCDTVLVPIVFPHADQAECIAVGCLNCGESIPLCVGIVMDGNPASDEAGR